MIRLRRNRPTAGGRPALTRAGLYPGWRWPGHATLTVAETPRQQASETYHEPRIRRCAGARERYHKLSDDGRTRSPTVTKVTSGALCVVWDLDQVHGMIRPEAVATGIGAEPSTGSGASRPAGSGGAGPSAGWAPRAASPRWEARVTSPSWEAKVAWPPEDIAAGSPSWEAEAAARPWPACWPRDWATCWPRAWPAHAGACCTRSHHRSLGIDSSTSTSTAPTVAAASTSSGTFTMDRPTTVPENTAAHAYRISTLDRCECPI